MEKWRLNHDYLCVNSFLNGQQPMAQASSNIFKVLIPEEQSINIDCSGHISI
jgi:hypothetical protein